MTFKICLLDKNTLFGSEQSSSNKWGKVLPSFHLKEGHTFFLTEDSSDAHEEP